jgi:hypothetical protein
MRYGTLTDDDAIRAARSPEGLLKRRKRRRWNPRRAAENLLISLATGAVVAVLAWIGVMWLTG